MGFTIYQSPGGFNQGTDDAAESQSLSSAPSPAKADRSSVSLLERAAEGLNLLSQAPGKVSQGLSQLFAETTSGSSSNYDPAMDLLVAEGDRLSLEAEAEPSALASFNLSERAVKAYLAAGEEELADSVLSYLDNNISIEDLLIEQDLKLGSLVDPELAIGGEVSPDSIAIEPQERMRLMIEVLEVDVLLEDQPSDIKAHLAKAKSIFEEGKDLEESLQLAQVMAQALALDKKRSLEWYVEPNKVKQWDPDQLVVEEYLDKLLPCLLSLVPASSEEPRSWLASSLRREIRIHIRQAITLGKPEKLSPEALAQFVKASEAGHNKLLQASQSKELEALDLYLLAAQDFADAGNLEGFAKAIGPLEKACQNLFAMNNPNTDLVAARILKELSRLSLEIGDQEKAIELFSRLSVLGKKLSLEELAQLDEVEAMVHAQLQAISEQAVYCLYLLKGEKEKAVAFLQLTGTSRLGEFKDQAERLLLQSLDSKLLEGFNILVMTALGRMEVEGQVNELALSSKNWDQALTDLYAALESGEIGSFEELTSCLEPYFAATSSQADVDLGLRSELAFEIFTAFFSKLRQMPTNTANLHQAFFDLTKQLEKAGLVDEAKALATWLQSDASLLSGAAGQWLEDQPWNQREDKVGNVLSWLPFLMSKGRRLMTPVLAGVQVYFWDSSDSSGEKVLHNIISLMFGKGARIGAEALIARSTAVELGAANFVRKRVAQGLSQSKSLKLKAWYWGSKAEALGFTLGSYGQVSWKRKSFSNWDLKAFATEAGAMMVLFALTRGTELGRKGAVKQSAKWTEQARGSLRYTERAVFTVALASRPFAYTTRIGSLTGSSYANECIHLHPKTEDGLLLRVADAAIIDAEMGVAGAFVHLVSVGRLSALERQNEAFFKCYEKAMPIAKTIQEALSKRGIPLQAPVARGHVRGHIIEALNKGESTEAIKAYYESEAGQRELDLLARMHQVDRGDDSKGPPPSLRENLGKILRGARAFVRDMAKTVKDPKKLHWKESLVTPEGVTIGEQLGFALALMTGEARGADPQSRARLGQLRQAAETEYAAEKAGEAIVYLGEHGRGVVVEPWARRTMIEQVLLSLGEGDTLEGLPKLQGKKVLLIVQSESDRAQWQKRLEELTGTKTVGENNSFIVNGQEVLIQPVRPLSNKKAKDQKKFFEEQDIGLVILDKEHHFRPAVKKAKAPAAEEEEGHRAWIKVLINAGFVEKVKEGTKTVFRPTEEAPRYLLGFTETLKPAESIYGPHLIEEASASLGELYASGIVVEPQGVVAVPEGLAEGVSVEAHWRDMEAREQVEAIFQQMERVRQRPTDSESGIPKTVIYAPSREVAVWLQQRLEAEEAYHPEGQESRVALFISNPEEKAADREVREQGFSSFVAGGKRVLITVDKAVESDRLKNHPPEAAIIANPKNSPVRALQLMNPYLFSDPAEPPYLVDMVGVSFRYPGLINWDTRLEIYSPGKVRVATDPEQTEFFTKTPMPPLAAKPRGRFNLSMDLLGLGDGVHFAAALRELGADNVSGLTRMKLRLGGEAFRRMFAGAYVPGSPAEVRRVTKELDLDEADTDRLLRAWAADRVAHYFGDCPIPEDLPPGDQALLAEARLAFFINLGGNAGRSKERLGIETKTLLAYLRKGETSVKMRRFPSKLAKLFNTSPGEQNPVEKYGFWVPAIEKLYEPETLTQEDLVVIQKAMVARYGPGVTSIVIQAVFNTSIDGFTSLRVAPLGKKQDPGSRFEIQIDIQADGSWKIRQGNEDHIPQEQYIEGLLKAGKREAAEHGYLDPIIRDERDPKAKRKAKSIMLNPFYNNLYESIGEVVEVFKNPEKRKALVDSARALTETGELKGGRFYIQGLHQKGKYGSIHAVPEGQESSGLAYFKILVEVQSDGTWKIKQSYTPRPAWNRFLQGMLEAGKLEAKEKELERPLIIDERTDSEEKRVSLNQSFSLEELPDFFADASNRALLTNHIEGDIFILQANSVGGIYKGVKAYEPGREKKGKTYLNVKVRIEDDGSWSITDASYREGSREQFIQALLDGAKLEMERTPALLVPRIRDVRPKDD